MKVPDQQAAIRRMVRLQQQGLSLRAIAAKLTESGVPVSHMGVAKALRAAAAD